MVCNFNKLKMLAQHQSQSLLELLLFMLLQLVVVVVRVAIQMVHQVAVLAELLGVGLLLLHLALLVQVD
jgi:uncharacterized membrane protein